MSRDFVHDNAPQHVTTSTGIIIKTVDMCSNLWNGRVDIISKCMTNTGCHFHNIRHQVYIAQGLHVGTSQWTTPAKCKLACAGGTGEVWKTAA